MSYRLRSWFFRWDWLLLWSLLTSSSFCILRILSTLVFLLLLVCSSLTETWELDTMASSLKKSSSISTLSLPFSLRSLSLSTGSGILAEGSLDFSSRSFYRIFWCSAILRSIRLSLNEVGPARLPLLSFGNFPFESIILGYSLQSGSSIFNTCLWGLL